MNKIVDSVIFTAQMIGGTAVLAVAFWACLGFAGMCEGSQDDLTNSFRGFCEFVTK